MQNIYEQLKAQREARQNGGNFKKDDLVRVGFFRLQPNQSCLVRFNITNTDSFVWRLAHKPLYPHEWKGLKNKFIGIGCLNAGSSERVCPFCDVSFNKENPSKIVSKPQHILYVPMLVSYRNPDGTFTPEEPVLWEKNYFFAEELAIHINNLGGDLSSTLFTITRNGGKGKDTKYIITPAPEKIYPDTLISRDFSAFDNYPYDKIRVLKKSASEMKDFLETGTWAVEEPTTNEAPVNVQPQVVQQTSAQATVVESVQPTPVAPTPTPVDQQAAPVTQPVTPAPAPAPAPVVNEAPASANPGAAANNFNWDW